MANMIQPFSSVMVTGPSASATNYIFLQSGGGSAWNATETQVNNVWSTAGYIDNFRMKITTAPGVGKSYAFTLRKNAASQTPTITISGTGKTGFDMANSFSVAAGDLLALQSVPTGTPAASGVFSFSFRFTATATNKSVTIFGCSTQLTSGQTRYASMFGDQIFNATETSIEYPVPTGGTLKNLYVVTDVSPGVADSVTVTNVQNGTPGALTCAVSNGTTASDTNAGHAVTVTAGDTFTWKLVASAVAFTSCRVFISGEFDPTTDGESINGFIPSNVTHIQNLAVYRSLAGNATWTATEANVQAIMPQATLKKLQVITTAPASGQTLISTVRKNTIDTSIAATVTGTATTASDTSNSVVVFDDDLISLRGTTSATTGTITPQIGLAYYIATPLFVQSTKGVSTSGGNTATTTAFPSTTTTGNTIIVAIGLDSATNTVSTVTDSASNTYSKATSVTNSNGFSSEIWYCSNITGGASHTVTATPTGSGNNVTVIAQEFSGLATSSALDKTHTATDAGTTASADSGATATTTQANEYIIGAFASTTGTNYQPGTSYTGLEITSNGAGISVAMESQSVSATGAYNGTSTLSQSNQGWNALVATFKTPGGAAAFMPQSNKPILQAINRASTY